MRTGWYRRTGSYGAPPVRAQIACENREWCMQCMRLRAAVVENDMGPIGCIYNPLRSFVRLFFLREAF